MTAFIAVALGMVLLASAFIWRPLLGPPAAWRLATVLSVGLLVFSVGVYTWVVTDPVPLDRIQAAPGIVPDSNPDSVPQRPSDDDDAAAAMPPEAIAAMVQRLADRLKNQPDDAQGWRMLARSYETLGRFEDSVQAYRSLLRVQGPDADVLTHYAVALGMTLGQSLSGEPEEALKEALRLDPRHPQALALSGSAAFEQHDYAAAIQHWEKLLSLTPADSDMRASIEANVEKARSLGRSAPTPNGERTP